MYVLFLRKKKYQKSALVGEVPAGERFAEDARSCSPAPLAISGQACFQPIPKGQSVIHFRGLKTPCPLMAALALAPARASSCSHCLEIHFMYLCHKRSVIPTLVRDVTNRVWPLMIFLSEIDIRMLYDENF